MKPRLMYVQRIGDVGEADRGGDGDEGDTAPEPAAGPSARVGRVTFSKTGRTLYYGGRALQRSGGEGSNYVDQATGEQFWLSSVKSDLRRRRWPGYGEVEVDEDAREEYERLLAGRRR